MRPILGGLGNIDENVLHMPTGKLLAVTIRFYNLTTHEWSIYWATDQNGFGTIPTVGSFGSDGIGLFYDREMFAGKPIVSRFTWTCLTTDHCHWEQAFSDNDGKTWERNWIMQFTRT